MKIIITILFALLISFSASSQIKVYLKDGEIVEGKIGLFTAKKFKLKQTKKGKSQSFKVKETDSVVLYNKRKSEVFHSVQDMHGRPRFFKLHKRGKINVYKDEGIAVTGFGAFSTVNYPIKKANEERCMNLFKGGPYWSNFAKVASEYFEDCPELASKIKNREKGFTNKDVLKVVEYYNEKCN